MDNQAVALRLELAMGADESLGRGPLQKCARLRVNGRAEKVVGGGIADVEFDGGIERDQFNQIGLEKCPLLARRLLFERLCAQFLYRTKRRDVEADLLREDRWQQKEETTEMKKADSQEIDASQCRFGSLTTESRLLRLESMVSQATESEKASNPCGNAEGASDQIGLRSEQPEIRGRPGCS